MADPKTALQQRLLQIHAAAASVALACNCAAAETCRACDVVDALDEVITWLESAPWTVPPWLER